MWMGRTLAQTTPVRPDRRPLYPPMVQVSRVRRQAGQAPARGLRMATHNVRGLLGGRHQQKLEQLLDRWFVQLRLDIVLVQETHLRTRFACGRAEARTAAWATDSGCELRWLWAPASTGRNSRGGTAIVLREDNIASGRLRLGNAVFASQDGRLLHTNVAWGGHNFHLASVYLPSGDPAGQRAFIAERIQPLLQSQRGRVLLGGDFNFVPDPCGLDRHSANPSQDRTTEQSTARAMAEVCERYGMVDVVRRRHPGARQWTFAHAASAAMARLDRWYAPCAALPHVMRCHAEGVPVGMSDHRPVVLHLAPAVPEARGPGRRRLPVRFLASQDLKARWQQWAAAQAAAASQDDAGLIAGWPAFLKRLRAKARALQAHYVQPPRATRQQARASAAALGRAFDRAAAAAVHGGDRDAALADVLAAERERAAVLQSTALDADRRARWAWLREGERPSPLLTKLVKLPKAASGIAALRAPGGHIVTDGRELAARMATHYAAVSARRETSAQARERVLAAIVTHGRRIASEAATQAGGPVVTVPEVKAAMKTTKPGRAPGPNDVPVQLWKGGGEAMAGLLARLFTAIGRTGTTPPGFLDGIVTCLPKPGGDPLQPAAYRPITLLNTEYRLLAKVLASRLGAALNPAVGPHQTAFLPGRRIGDNILLLQLLPHLLASSAEPGRHGATGAALLFLDIAKAYDSLDREFLFSAMEAMGAGGGLVRWARTLLTGTRAAAYVNGWTSAAAGYEAGVRQGCPLSPALYLFVAEALARWLQAHPAVVGLDALPSTRLASSHYADDTVVVLEDASEERVRATLQLLEVYADATGQHVNPTKSSLLALGSARRPAGHALPPTIAGVPLHTRVVGLGVPFEDGGDPQPDWQPCLERVSHAYGKLARLPLSAFGRGTAASSYGVSTLLYRAEFCGLPDSVRDTLDRWTKGLVDRRVAPDSRTSALPGVPSALLHGRPVEGGFGALALEQHVKGRHAMLAKRMLHFACGEGALGGGAPPWVAIAMELLRHACPQRVPELALLLAPLAPLAAPLPPPLARLAAGLAALGPPECTFGATAPAAEEAPPQAPGWTGVMPLLDNPLLQMGVPQGRRTVRLSRADREADSSLMAILEHLPGIRTIADLVVLDRTTRNVDGLIGKAFALRDQQLLEVCLSHRVLSLPVSRICCRVRREPRDMPT